MNIMIITDTHFSHSKMLEYEARPVDFEEKIKKNIFNNVTEKDILIHLGDVCIGRDKEHNEWFAKLPCKKWLIRGNHDGKSITFYNQYWDCVVERIDLEIYGKHLVLTHKPIAIPEDQINIHGHCHSNPRAVELINDNRHILVKVEHEYKPYNLRKLIRA